MLNAAGGHHGMHDHHKSTIQTKTLSPEWQEDISVGGGSDILQAKQLVLVVEDSDRNEHDLGVTDQVIGRCQIPLPTHMFTLAQEAVSKLENCVASQWFPLLDDAGQQLTGADGLPTEVEVAVTFVQHGSLLAFLVRAQLAQYLNAFYELGAATEVDLTMVEDEDLTEMKMSALEKQRFHMAFGRSVKELHLSESTKERVNDDGEGATAPTLLPNTMAGP